MLERHSPNSSEPEAKKPKLNQKWDEGYTENKMIQSMIVQSHFHFHRIFAETTQELQSLPVLTCNTEKDKSEPLHRRTAGKYHRFVAWLLITKLDNYVYH